MGNEKTAYRKQQEKIEKIYEAIPKDMVSVNGDMDSEQQEIYEMLMMYREAGVAGWLMVYKSETYPEKHLLRFRHNPYDVLGCIGGSSCDVMSSIGDLSIDEDKGIITFKTENTIYEYEITGSVLLREVVITTRVDSETGERIIERVRKEGADE